jgi:hypothetical protein
LKLSSREMSPYPRSANTQSLVTRKLLGLPKCNPLVSESDINAWKEQPKTESEVVELENSVKSIPVTILCSNDKVQVSNSVIQSTDVQFHH